MGRRRSSWAGAENLNLVTPTHQAPQIFAALRRIRPGPLRLPVVYNCGGYESAGFLRELTGEISPRTFLNIMDQYHPAWQAPSLPELHRRVLRSEVEEVIAYARRRGVNRVMG